MSAFSERSCALKVRAIISWLTGFRTATHTTSPSAASIRRGVSRTRRTLALLVVMNINTMTFVAPNLAWGKARGGRIPRNGAATDEQRCHRSNSAQPFGRQFFFGQTSLLAPYRSTLGYARRSRLVWPKNSLPRTSSYLCSGALNHVQPQTCSPLMRLARLPFSTFKLLLQIHLSFSKLRPWQALASSLRENLYRHGQRGETGAGVGHD